MDSGVETTQRVVIGAAIFLGVTIVLVIGYSLYVKANRAEEQLANKLELDSQTQADPKKAGISLTGESKNSAGFSYDGLIQKRDEPATTTNFEVVNETPVEPEPEIYPEEEAVPPEEPEQPAPKPVVKAKPVYVDDDRPLTAAEIEAIRKLPVDDSPSGNLQTSLEEESNGQYKARY